MKKAMVLLLVLTSGVAWGQDAAAPTQKPANEAGPGRLAVLDTYGTWRMRAELAVPVTAAGKVLETKWRWMNYGTSDVPEAWTGMEFDDHVWTRGPATLAPKTALVKRLCVRGKFGVTNAGAVKDLKLNVTYRGGLIVHVNGKEATRENVDVGAAIAKGAGEEERKMEWTVPTGMLRKGMNVIALEVVRGAYPETAELEKELDKGAFTTRTCEVVQVRLTAESGEGLIPNVGRPEGFRVWNADMLETDLDLNWGDPNEPLKPVVIEGARNGKFSGKVLVGSTQPIKGLKATAGELRGEGGVIPGGNVEVRYGIAWGEQALSEGSEGVSPYPSWPMLLSGLSEQAPGNVAVATYNPIKTYRGTFWANSKATGNYWQPKGQKFMFSGGPQGGYREYMRLDGELKPVGGAGVPVWLTVNVPENATAGTYKGKVKIEAAGEKAVDVELAVHVADWRVPNTKDYRTTVDMIECPDTLALEYDVPLWSEKHWEMIGKAFKLIGETGSRSVYVPLIAHTNLGNEESMVRWIRKADGTYDYDFSTLEKYLDVAAKNMGTPKMVVLVVWDLYMMPDLTADQLDRQKAKGNRDFRTAEMAGNVIRKRGYIGKGPMVTVVDQATGKRENVFLPLMTEVETSKTLWQPVFDGVRERLKARGAPPG